jgi:hypothetical protein
VLGREAERTRATSDRIVRNTAPASTSAHRAHARLTKARIAVALRRAGRKRRIDDLAADILQRLQIPQSRQPHLAEKSWAAR